VIADMLRHGRGHVVNISATVAERADSSSPSVLTALTKGGWRRPPDRWRSSASLGDQMPPIGRVGQISDVVDAILFLESAPMIRGQRGEARLRQQC